MEFHIEKITHFSVEFPLKTKPNQACWPFTMHMQIQVNQSESLKQAQVAGENLCDSKGQFRGLTSDLLRKWRENCSQSQGVTMKIKYVFF